MAIKAVVTVDGDHITCNGYVIDEGMLAFYICEDGGKVLADAEDLEGAIKWCMEN